MEPASTTEPQGSAALNALVGAAFLAGGFATFMLLRAITSWEPVTCMLVAIFGGGAAVALAMFAWLKVKLWQIRRDAQAPDAFERIMKRPEMQKMMAETAADEKELGIDVERKAHAERTTAASVKRLETLMETPAYLAADEAGRQAMLDRASKEDMEKISREIERIVEQSTARITALREYRELERKLGSGGTPEERFRLQNLRDKAYWPGK